VHYFGQRGSSGTGRSTWTIWLGGEKQGERAHWTQRSSWPARWRGAQEAGVVARRNGVSAEAERAPLKSMTAVMARCSNPGYRAGIRSVDVSDAVSIRCL
jgi:hypothetical protein